MKKFIIMMLVVTTVLTTGCKKQAWNTEINLGNWTVLKSDKGEVVYDGPSEYIDDEYERDALTDSEFNWIWNNETKEFDKIERGTCTFTE